MIKYNLKCDNDHEFESWFSNSKEFDNLKKRKLLECIFCSSKRVNKSIMAPMVSSTNGNSNVIKAQNDSLKDEKNKLFQLRKFVETNFEFVGENFSSKVREVYYDNNKLTDQKIDTYRNMILRENNREAFISRSLSKPKDYTDRLKLISIPTQIIWGNQDTWIPVSNAKFFEAEIQNIRIDIMDETGHIPMEERPQESLDLLLDFIISN